MLKQIFREDAPIVAKIHAYFARLQSATRGAGERAAAPTREEIVRMVSAAFWASLKREEGWPTRLSIGFFAHDGPTRGLVFAKSLPLGPKSLAKVAPAVERPGVHLGVWPDASGDLRVWGASLDLPRRCFVLEVIAPGVIVVKHPEVGSFRKFTNVAVIEGSESKFIQETSTTALECRTLMASLLEEALAHRSLKRAHPATVLVELALSMRAHGRGGTLLIVPSDHSEWRSSVVAPLVYAAKQPFVGLRRTATETGESGNPRRARLARAVEAVAGLTAVDGATIVTEDLDVIAFGVKLARRDGEPLVEQVLVSEPIEGSNAEPADPAVLGGTRHLSAAQFVHDQREALALVASQDGRFTVFAWSECDRAIHARRIDVLLL